LGAFLIDGALLVGVAIVLGLVMGLLVATTRGLGMAVAVVCFFLLRNFYFTWFECRWQGATPGKRALGLRVIDAQGGVLEPEAVFARNLMREIELFVPLVAVLAPGQVLPHTPAWARIAATGWLFVFALLPFFNRDRLRVGDLVAGTLVVLAPRTVLLEDLSSASRGQKASGQIAFTVEQLDLYGIHELQVLETLLRGRRPSEEALEAVAGKIQQKIGWDAASKRIDAERFLHAFYTAQRARLEQRMLLGERRERKRAGRVARKP